MAHLAFLSFDVIVDFGHGNWLVTWVAVIAVFSCVYLLNSYHFICPITVSFEMATGVMFVTTGWFFSQVSSFMYVEFAGLSKRLVACIAGVSFDATVNESVSSKTARMSERAVAFEAFV